MTLRPMPPLDVEGVLARLKGFQRAAVETAFERLYTASDSTRRFLVADEVGLGKTLIARGIVARAIEHLRDTVKRIDIVYLCSNARIARQNVRRLNPFPGVGFAQADRITMLPVTLSELTRNRLNFVAFTPGTSLDLKSSEGQRRERALLYWLLRELWPVRGQGAKNLFQGGITRRDRWLEFLEGFPEENPISRELTSSFHETLRRTDARQRADGEQGLADRFYSLCDRCARYKRKWPDDLRADRRGFIGELRALLARACVDQLEPNLVILDEFQRFKHLLDPEGGGDAAQLAQAFFEWQNDEAEARVLLLSATPYKMYTLAHEEEEDDHYADFLRTVDFLEPDAVRGRGFRSHLEEYRRELYRLAEGGGGRLPGLKRAIESSLRRVMSRTERIGVVGARDGMLRAIPPCHVTLTKRDVCDFVHLQGIADLLEQPNVVEFWKSAPYLLNFMEEYRLKKELVKRLDDPRKSRELSDRLACSDELLLEPSRLKAYGGIDPANPRLRALLTDVLQGELWRCLWLPPSLPSYQLEGPFAQAAKRPGGATKRLVFSAWAVVPKTIAALLSYEVERRVFCAMDDAPVNTPEARKRRTALLRFGRAEGRLTGMPVLGLVYPSIVLAKAGDLVGQRLTSNGTASLGAAVDAVARMIAPRLQSATEQLGVPVDGPEDESWYWRAPLVLDRLHDAVSSEGWWGSEDLASSWAAGASHDEDDAGGDLWDEHVTEAREAATLLGRADIGRPPADLAHVLAYLAIAGPANAALRALCRALPDGEIDSRELRLAAGRIAWASRSLFNRPEAMAILRAADREVPYWRRVLEYSAEGDLDAVLAEHVHVVRELHGLFDLPAGEAAQELAAVVAASLSIRASRQEYQSVRVHAREGWSELQRERNLRGFFAMRFSTEKSDDDDAGQRADVVRDAFNSPFWPFVLATTSVGQEGLDFHAWCHAVVHWNLPANPVDLEQREGRVHRFKGHAIRKNVARAHGSDELAEPSRDPWKGVFDRAREASGDQAGGLIPYWLYELEDGAYIERHVPVLPLSKDELRLEALRRSLAVYRMVFGQPRQDDLLAYLIERVPEKVIRARLDELRIDLQPIARS